MSVVAYVDPTRSYLPATGVGRHMNNMLLGLARRVPVELLCASEFVRDGVLDARSPLRELPTRTIPWRMSTVERAWKLFGRPAMDADVAGADWVYLPEECRFPLTRRRSRPRLAITVHDVHALETRLPWSSTLQHRIRRWRWQAWLGKAVREADAVLTVSQFVRRRLIDLFALPPSRVHVAGNGVEELFFASATRAPAVPDSIVTVVGGLVARKGGDHVLAVAQHLAARRSPLRIAVVGRSEARLEALARNARNVDLLGPVDDPTLAALLSRSVSLLMPSEYEGFGIPALEAMAAGTVAVVSNRAALPETVGSAAIVIDPEDHPSIADLLNQLHEHPSLRTPWLVAGAARARSFTWSACVDRLMKALGLASLQSNNLFRSAEPSLGESTCRSASLLSMTTTTL
jgi:glycosyltransferase involved in cell wall biosynthesis